MQLRPVFLLLEPLYNLFGYIMHLLYQWLGNYGLVLIVFTLAYKILMLPLSLKQSKMMLKQGFLQDDINEIKRLYAKDPRKQQEAQMALMKSAGVGQGAGCLISLIPLIILFGIWPPMRQPLLYIARVVPDHLVKIANYLVQNSWLTDAQLKQLGSNDLPVVAALNEHGQALAHSVNEGWLNLSQLINMNFLGMDLGLTPSFRPSVIFGPQMSTYLPLLLLPVLTIATMMWSMSLMKLTQINYQTKEEKAREKRNPAKAGQNPDPTAGMMKTMNWTMPILMLFTVFAFPAAMGIFWIVSNLFQIFQSYLTYYLYTKPARALMAEQRQKSLAARRK